MIKASNHNRTARTYIIASSIALALLVVAGGFASYHYQLWPFRSPEKVDNHSQIQEKQASLSLTKQAKTNSQNSSANVDTSKSTSEIPVTTAVAVNIDELSQDSGMVTYAASVTGGSVNGTCSAVFTNDISRPVTRTTTSAANKCGPVSIPENEFSAIGKWTLTLRFYTNDTQAIATKDIGIK